MSIDRLSPLDRFMLRVSGRWPQDVGALAILDGRPLIDEAGRFRIEAARAAIEGRLDRFARSRQVIHVPRRGLGTPCWVDAPDFEIRAHVRELALEPPADEARLLAAVEDLRRQPMDPSRPMWQMWFLTGLPEGRVGWFVRMHHTIADGMAAMLTIASLLETDPEELTIRPRPWHPSPLPTAPQLLADNLRRRATALGRGLATLAHLRASLRRFGAALPGIKELLVERPGTRTSIDRMCGPARRIAVIRSSLTTFKAIGRAHGGTVNDVLLALTAAGLRRLFHGRREPLEGMIVRVYVPVSLRKGLRGPQQGNLIGQMAVPLSLAEPDPGRRLRQIVAETSMRKSKLRTSLGTLMHGGGIVRWLMLSAVMRQRVNVTSTSLRGPDRPLYLAGARLLEVFPVLPLAANEPLGVGALSYAGALNIGVVVDRDTFPDLDVLVDGMRDELRLLAAGVPGLVAGATTPPLQVIGAVSATA